MANEQSLQPAPATLVQFLEDGARRFGSEAALLFKPGLRYQRWSYERLLLDARRVAVLLRSRGLEKGDRAIIWGPNCPQWVLSYFGCAIAGVVMVPIDVRSAPDFVERVIDKTQPELAFVSRLTPIEQESFAPSRVYFEDLDSLCAELAPAELERPLPSDLLEIMFTSGTTGDPKGVMLTHANLMANLAGSLAHVPANPDYRLISVLPLSHMFEQMGGLLLPLSSGADVTYPTSLQPSALVRVMRERRVNLMLLVPQVLELFMNGIEREVDRHGRRKVWDLLQKLALRLPFRWRRLLFRSVHKRFGGELAVVFTGGAALDPALGLKWEALGVRIIQGYGATECSPVISSHTIMEPRYDSVGRPIPGVEVKIADDGEIIVRGPNIAQGYWQAQEQTAAAFEDGWYKTGDLGFVDAKGYIHIQGRKKDMIALASGQKVFPEDIEAALKKEAGVADAVVVGLPRASGPEVHAALIMSDGADPRQAIESANAKLADHQQIRGFTPWPGDDFPRTHTLKVRKNLVIEQLLGRAPGTAASAKPSETPSSEARLTRILAEMSSLPAASITPEQTLGGDLNLDSLRRVELLSVIEEELGFSLDETAVEGGTTVADLTVMTREEGRRDEALKFPRWGRTWWCRPLRAFLQSALVLPALRRLYRIEVKGGERLVALEGAHIIVANHNLHLDNGIFLDALGPRIRKRLAVAGAAELWRNPVWAVLNPLLGNAFPFSREGAVRASMEHLCSLLDEGWHVLIYPEGVMTAGGPIQPFKSGIGLLAAGAEAPVLPMRLHIDSFGWPRRLPFMRRGSVTVQIGESICFTSGDSYLEAAEAIEDAVRSL